MNAYPESETADAQPAPWTERDFSRRRLGIRLLNRLGWCGLLPPASRASIPAVASDECSNLARYDTLHDVIATVARRQRIARHLREVNAPEVGVFWFIQRPKFAPELCAYSVALQEGKAYGMYIDGPHDHDSAWPWSQLMDPWFRNSEPRDWPRGRVLFNVGLRHFEVDLTKQLLQPQFTAEVLRHFHLPEASTVFKPDPHYSKTRFAFNEGPRERIR